MPERQPNDRFAFSLLLMLVLGAVAGWFCGGLIHPTITAGGVTLRDQAYTGRWEAEPFVINDERRLPVPFAYGDFDLQLEVELGEGAIVDLVVRRVEPRTIGAELEPFHGRFSALRLSADRAGPAWLSREAALLGDRDAGGVDLSPGHLATVWVNGRGRALDANVAGKKLPRFFADDIHGSFLLVARGGTAAVRSLTITPLGLASPWLWSRWFWAGLGIVVGGLLAVIIRLRSAQPSVGFAFALAAWLLAGSQSGPPLWHPPPATMLAYLAGTAAIALLLVRGMRLLAVIGALLIVAAPPVQRSTAQLDRLFGTAAGSHLVQAHAQLVDGPFVIHTARETEHRVFLLGGQMLYGRPLAQPKERHLELLVGNRVAALLGLRAPAFVDVPCLPTFDGWSEQQWAMFSRFYTGYRPDVLVFGVSEFEDVDPFGARRPRQRSLEATLAEVRDWCAANDVGLVLFGGEGLSRPEFSALSDLAGRDESGPVRFVHSAGGPDGASADDAWDDLAQRLATQIADLMQ